ncbi:hypothetical protein ACTXT7_013098, partial [Hymenolepis weldensis]
MACTRLRGISALQKGYRFAGESTAAHSSVRCGLTFPPLPNLAALLHKHFQERVRYERTSKVRQIESNK